MDCWGDEKVFDMGMLPAIKGDTGYILLCSQELYLWAVGDFSKQIAGVLSLLFSEQYFVIPEQTFFLLSKELTSEY